MPTMPNVVSVCCAESKNTVHSYAGSRCVWRRRSSRIRMARRRCGAAVVEFAFVAPVLLLLILGIIEFGRLFMVQQVLTNASREGARRAILEGSTSSEVDTVVQDYLSSASISGAMVSVSPSALNTVGFGDPVTVTISVPFEQVSYLPAPFFLAGKQLIAASVMRAERPE